jgi:hypothetical protein
LPFANWLCFCAGYEALRVWLWVYGFRGLMRKTRLMDWLFVFFVLGGETGLINENEGDI